MTTAHSSKAPMRGAVIGCGFWAKYQLAAWRELPGVEIVAVCDSDAAKAAATAGQFGIPRVYTDAEALFRDEQLDFVDIITDVASHAEIAHQAIRQGVPAIVQKPMAPDWKTAAAMVAAAQAAGVPLLVHENFRWQVGLRRVKALLDADTLGQVFKARLSFCSAFPVFDNQPALAKLQQFILMDVGTHVLDVARFLFGEASALHCRTARVNQAIQGEDVADVLLKMENGMHCFVELSYASWRERESFPETLALIEGKNGTLELGIGGEITITVRTEAGRQTRRETVAPPFYSWADPAYAAAHAGIVACHQNLLAGLRGEDTAETTGADNLRTLQLVFACYESAKNNTIKMITPYKGHL